MPKQVSSTLKLSALFVIVTVIVSGIYAQESDTNAKVKRRGPLPYYFGKIGVDNAQRQKLYSIQESYDEKLKALRLEMKKLLAERDAAMEATLTPGQKLRLSELKAAAVKDAKQGTGPAKTKPKAE